MNSTSRRLTAHQAFEELGIGRKLPGRPFPVLLKQVFECHCLPLGSVGSVGSRNALKSWFVRVQRLSGSDIELVRELQCKQDAFGVGHLREFGGLAASAFRRGSSSG